MFFRRKKCHPRGREDGRWHCFITQHWNINKIAFWSNAVYPRMRAFSYAWSLPVTWQRWRSHHSIRHAENPMLHTNFTALCVTETVLFPIEVLHCGNRDFAPVTLNLTRLSSHTNLTRIPWSCTGWSKMNFLRQGFQSCRLSVWQIDINTPSKYTTALRGWPIIDSNYSGYIRCVLVSHGHGVSSVTLTLAAMFSVVLVWLDVAITSAARSWELKPPGQRAILSSNQFFKISAENKLS